MQSDNNTRVPCDAEFILGAGDNETNIELNIDDESDIGNGSALLDDIYEVDESDDESTSSERDTTVEEEEELSENEELNDSEMELEVEEDQLSRTNIKVSSAVDTVGIIQSGSNKTNVATFRGLSHTTMNERPREYISILGAESFMSSVLAATTIDKIEKCFGRPIELIRVMPNTPLSVGEGCCIFTPNKLAKVENINITRKLLESSGLCLEVPENQINAMASISGSGPAFMYTIIEAMADGGVKMGVPRAEAIKLAAQTMLGAAKMVLQTGKHSAQLKDEVCSAGGTTIAGIHSLEKGGIRSAIIDAVEAATKRSIEMGQ